MPVRSAPAKTKRKSLVEMISEHDALQALRSAPADGRAGTRPHLRWDSPTPPHASELGSRSRGRAGTFGLWRVRSATRPDVQCTATIFTGNGALEEKVGSLQRIGRWFATTHRPLVRYNTPAVGSLQHTGRQSALGANARL